jgi:hypothetical protein
LGGSSIPSATLDLFKIAGAFHDWAETPGRRIELFKEQAEPKGSASFPPRREALFPLGALLGI